VSRDEATRRDLSLTRWTDKVAASEIHEGGRAPDGNDPAHPVISVVTVCFNPGEDLALTLDAIAALDWPNLEYIVVDGGSTDGTVERLRARRAEITRWISEPDAGIADAFNKGVALSRGAFVQICNAGDRLAPDHLDRAAAALLAAPALGLVYGDVAMRDAEGRITRVIRARADLHGRPLTSMAPAPHPAMLVRRTIYERIGLFDPELKFAMDYDWLLRVKAAGFQGRHVRGLRALMAEGGASNTHKQRRDRENRDIALRHGELGPIRANALWRVKAIFNALERLEARPVIGPAARGLRTLKQRLLRRDPALE